MKNVKKSMALMMVGMMCATMQAQTIKGCVTDAQSKEPLIGATVEVKGTTKKTVTLVDVFNFDGEPKNLSLNLELTVKGATIGDNTITISGDFADEKADKVYAPASATAKLVVGKQTNKYENATYQNLWEAVKVVLRKTFITINAYITNKKTSH